MLFPYITLENETEIVYSSLLPDGSVKVVIEKPVIGGFYSAVCWLPKMRWESVSGFDEKEIEQFDILLKKDCDNIIRNAENLF